jgi:predicted Fe-Mo cluster-binding NifX family protein
VGKVGLALSRADRDAPLAEHFGKARWLLVVEAPDRCTFFRNTWLEGRGVVAELASRGCTDLVARRMGPGAYAHAVAAGMKVWEADDSVTGGDVVARLADGTLRPLVPAAGEHAHAHRHGPH